MTAWLIGSLSEAALRLIADAPCYDAGDGCAHKLARLLLQLGKQASLAPAQIGEQWLLEWARHQCTSPIWAYRCNPEACRPCHDERRDLARTVLALKTAASQVPHLSNHGTVCTIHGGEHVRSVCESFGGQCLFSPSAEGSR